MAGVTLLVCTLAADAVCSALGFGLRRVDPAADGTDSQLCPYGYGDGCDHFWDDMSNKVPVNEGGNGEIDPKTREKLKDILGGIISSMTKHPVKGLVQKVSTLNKQDLAQTASSVAALKAMWTLIPALRRKHSGAALLGRLSGTQADEASASAVADVLAVASKSPYDSACPFGFCASGGGGEIDPATKEQVANILKGVISNLSKGHKSLKLVSQAVASSFAVRDEKHQGVKKALGSLLSTMVRIGKDSTALVSKLVGSKVADGTAESVSAVLKELLKSKDCPFGYGEGCHGVDSDEMPIDPATKEEVANILKGMIKNLSGK